MTRRLVAAAALAAAAFATPASASPVSPGGQCDGVVDTMCRSHVCGPDELDCGMIPPCVLWVRALGCVVG